MQSGRVSGDEWIRCGGDVVCVVCSVNGYTEMKGTGVEDDYVLCGVDRCPEMKGTGVEEVMCVVRGGRIAHAIRPIGWSNSTTMSMLKRTCIP